jgi:hypothetical protein
MSFTIQYLKDGAVLWESVWPADVPPPTAFTKLGMKRRGADTVIVSDAFGKDVTVITEAPTK